MEKKLNKNALTIADIRKQSQECINMMKRLNGSAVKKSD